MNYHKLVADIVGHEKGEKIFLDRQLAAVFELQKNPEYKSPTIKILSGMRAQAQDYLPRAQSFVEQIDETVSVLKSNIF